MKKQASKVYRLGGQLHYQAGYKRKGKFVRAHLKTYPDNKVSNNRKYLLGY